MAIPMTNAALVSIDLETGNGEPLHRRLYEQIRRVILAGGLPPGAKLPPTRDFARELGISRNTVLSAFEQLAAEGYTEARVGSGTRVALALPESQPLSAPEIKLAPARDVFSELPERIRSLPHRRRPGRRPDRPFEPGIPNLDLFPFDDWSRLITKFWRNPPRDLLLSGDMAGYRPLREAVAAYLVAVRGLKCGADQVIITSGAQQGIDLCARTVLEPGDDVVLEDPGYRGLVAAFTAAEAHFSYLPVDGEGLSVETGRRMSLRPKVIAVTPTHQFPMGHVMSLARRLDLLEWAGETGAWVLEDDFDSEYRYRGRPLAAMQGLDASGRVIYAGTLSKVMFPALRLGYLVVPEGLVDPMLSVRAAVDEHPSITAQPALAAFIESGRFAQHVRRTRLVYGELQSRLIERLKASLDGALTVPDDDTGMHLTCVLSDALASWTTDLDIMREAAKLEVTAPALSTYCQNDGPQGLVLGYTGYPERKMLEAADLLAEAVEAA